MAPDAAEDRAALLVRAREIAEAHQELADDLAAGEDEAPLEELHPFVLRQRMVRIKPGGEAAMAVADGAQAPGVLDHGGDLEAVADDRRIVEQPLDVARAEFRHPVDVVALERLGEGGALLQHG